MEIQFINKIPVCETDSKDFIGFFSTFIFYIEINIKEETGIMNCMPFIYNLLFQTNKMPYIKVLSLSKAKVIQSFF